MRHGSLMRWLIAPVADQAQITRADVLFAVVLSAAAALSAAGLEGSNADNANAGWAAASAVLLMSSPVLLVRRWPVPVAAVLAVGSGLNWLVMGIWSAAAPGWWQCSTRRSSLAPAGALGPRQGGSGGWQWTSPARRASPSPAVASTRWPQYRRYGDRS